MSPIRTVVGPAGVPSWYYAVVLALEECAFQSLPLQRLAGVGVVLRDYLELDGLDLCFFFLN